MNNIYIYTYEHIQEIPSAWTPANAYKMSKTSQVGVWIHHFWQVLSVWYPPVSGNWIRKKMLVKEKCWLNMVKHGATNASLIFPQQISLKFSHFFPFDFPARSQFQRCQGVLDVAVGYGKNMEKTRGFWTGEGQGSRWSYPERNPGIVFVGDLTGNFQRYVISYSVWGGKLKVKGKVLRLGFGISTKIWNFWFTRGWSNSWSGFKIGMGESTFNVCRNENGLKTSLCTLGEKKSDVYPGTPDCLFV